MFANYSGNVQCSMKNTQFVDIQFPNSVNEWVSFEMAPSF